MATTTGVSTSQPYSGMQSYLDEYLARARNLSTAPSASGIAPLAPQQRTGLMMTEQRALSGSPVMNASKQNLTSTLNGDYLDITKNPAWDPMQKAITDSYGRGVAAQTDAAAARSNNLGSSAYREQVGANQRALGESLSSAAGGLYNSERGRQMQANLFAPQAAAADYADASALMGVGGAYQGQMQKEMDWPYKQLDVMGGALGVPSRYGTTTTTNETQDPQVGTGSKILGGLLTAGGLYNAYTGMGSPLGTPSDWYQSLFGGGGDYGGFNSNWAYGDAIDSGSFTAGSDAAATGAGTAAGGLNYGGVIGGLGSLYNISQGNGGLMDYAKTAKTGYDLYNAYNAAQATTAAGSAAGAGASAGTGAAGAAGSSAAGSGAAGASSGGAGAAGTGALAIAAAYMALMARRSAKDKMKAYEGANRTLQRLNEAGVDNDYLNAKSMLDLKSTWDTPEANQYIDGLLNAARTSETPYNPLVSATKREGEDYNEVFKGSNSPYIFGINSQFQNMFPDAINAAGGVNDIAQNYATYGLPGFHEYVNEIGTANRSKMSSVQAQIDAINQQRFGRTYADWEQERSLR